MQLQCGWFVMTKAGYQTFQRIMQPVNLAFEYRYSSQDEVLLVRVANGACVIQVKQIHNKKAAG